MASKNFSGILKDPLGEFAAGDIYRFTHVSNTGEVIKGSTSILKIGEDGSYDIDIEYGNVIIESRDIKTKCWINHGTTTINADTTATTLPNLLNALIPASDALVLQLEAILSDANAAADRAEAATAGFGTAADADVTTSPTDNTAGRALRVDDAYAVSSQNYHSGNTSFNLITALGASSNQFLGRVTKRKDGVDRFRVFKDLSGKNLSKPSGVTVTGTFSLRRADTGVIINATILQSDITLEGASSTSRLCLRIDNKAVSDIVNANSFEYELCPLEPTSKIEINY